MPPTYQREQLGETPGASPLEQPKSAPSQPSLKIDSQKAKQLVITRFDNSRQASNLQFTRMARWYKMFRNYQVTKNYQGLANLFVPEPYRVVRKKTAKLSNAIKKISATPETQQDNESAKIASHLLNYLRDKLGWKITEKLAIQESRIVGISWIKALWNVSRETQQKPWKGFDVSFDTADHILFNSDATIQDIFDGNTKWIIHQYEADLQSLKDNPNYDVDSIKILESRSGNSRPDQNVLTQSRTMFPQSQRSYTVPDQKKFVILEYWGKFPFELEGPDGTKTIEQREALIVVADKTVTLRAEENPYKDILPDNPKPFVPVVAAIVGQESYPVGDIEPAESLFNELNDTRNQRMDTVTLNIDPAKEVLRGANIDEKDLVARRGWIIKSNIPNGVRFIPPDMQGVRAAIDEEKTIRGDIQQVTGVIDFSPGSDVQAGVSIDTAKGTIIAQGEADVLSEDELETLKISLRMLYRIILAYAQKFLDREFSMRVVEEGIESFTNVSGQSIQGNMDLDIEMQTLQDTTTQQQLALLLLNIAKGIPGANIGKFFTDFVEITKDKANIQDYYQQPQPQPPEPPKVSISLRGELNPFEADAIYKTIPGVDPHMGDIAMRPEGRQIMKGQLPEDQENFQNALGTGQALQSMQQADDESSAPQK